MAAFVYRGRDVDGKAVDGQLSASNRDSAASQLLQRGITPVSIIEKADDEKKSGFNIQLTKPKVSTDELILLTRQLYALTKAGIPIIRALNGLGESSTNPRLKETLASLAQSLVSGSDLASAFRQHPDLFSPIYVSMVHIGESTGNLDDALIRLVAHLEMERETTKRIKSALRYPTMVVVAISVAMIVITMFVIPSFSSVFNKLGADLPFATKLLMVTSSFMQNYWHVLFACLTTSWFFFRRYIRSHDGELWWDEKKLKFPLIGSILERIALARFSRSFAMMLKAGVPILKCMTIVSESVGNRHIGRAVNTMATGVERGERLTSTAAATGLFTPLVLQMMSVGEETGSVDTLLDEVADFYEQEIDYELKQLADAIEPILLVFLGGLVLVLALGVFLPIWELSGAVSGK
ncbi:type II secretion system F family protein [Thalassolituus sp.]|jgi:MSHA biogenesis protein MshG|uniref:type II secretion system F family protein n=1 Tax=Thalassolituus sp. TaxID=2030822 RepID=UPI002A8405FD|nr:type II secretion system F family protein [Thalassolituus sp.]